MLLHYFLGTTVKKKNGTGILYSGSKNECNAMQVAIMYFALILDTRVTDTQTQTCVKHM